MTRNDVRFDGRALVVTGAGRGLGRAQALLLAERGGGVVVADNGSAMDGSAAGSGPAESVADAIRAGGGQAAAFTGDLATGAGCEGAVAACMDAFGRIDGIIHYASPCPQPAPLGDVPDRVIELVMAVNPLAAMRLARAAWPHMARQRHGRIILTPSAALYGAPGNAPYAAAKAALIGVVRCLAADGAADGITVNGVMPSAASRMTDTFLPGGYREWFAKAMPPEKVAAGVAWLASADCAVTGEILAMGGGRIARVTLAEGEGVVLADMSPEVARQSMGAILADTRLSFPRDLAERTATVSALLGDQR